MIASLTAYPVAVAHVIVKLITRAKGVHFRVTSKQTTTAEDHDNDKFAEMYELWWVPMMIPAAVVLFSNILAIGVAMGKAIVYGRE
jgi:mixed-linked glucan synthase